MVTDLKALRREMAEEACGDCDLPQEYAETIDKYLRDYALAVLRAEPSEKMLSAMVEAHIHKPSLSAIWNDMAAERAREIG